jgi:preprotein translocase subunit SecE
MTQAQVETVTSGADKAKLAVAALLVLGAVAAYYLLGQQDTWVRVVAPSPAGS